MPSSKRVRVHFVGQKIRARVSVHPADLSRLEGGRDKGAAEDIVFAHWPFFQEEGEDRRTLLSVKKSAEG